MEAEVIKIGQKDTIGRIHFWRQVLVSSVLNINSFLFGLNMGAPTVMIPQIRKEANNTNAIDIHMESWLSSVLGFSGLPWVFILSIFAYSIGRKRTALLVAVTTLIGFIVFYWASSLTYILISQLLQGPLASFQVCVGFMFASEYTSAQYRPIVITFSVATVFWGIWVSNAIGTFVHWDYIALIGLIFSIYVLVTVVVCPESPYWLAMRGRREECIAAHQWLKGTCKDSTKELEGLLDLDVESKSPRLTFSSIRKHTRDFFKVILLPEVYKALGMCALCVTTFHFTGKVACTMYSIKIIKKITSSESVAYTGMLILDGVTVIGMYSGGILMKHLNRRTFFLVSTFLTIILLLTNSLYLYFIKLSVINENVYVSIGLLSILFLVISMGPLILSPALTGDLIPLKSRNICTCLSGFYYKSTMSVMLKLTPYIFQLIGFHGTFLFFAIACSMCLYFAYKYLPDTKNKTIIEISVMFKESSNLNKEAKELMPLKSNRNECVSNE